PHHAPPAAPEVEDAIVRGERTTFARVVALDRPVELKGFAQAVGAGGPDELPLQRLRREARQPHFARHGLTQAPYEHLEPSLIGHVREDGVRFQPSQIHGGMLLYSNTPGSANTRALHSGTAALLRTRRGSFTIRERAEVSARQVARAGANPVDVGKEETQARIRR